VPRDPQALGVMLEELSEDAPLRTRIGAANRVRASTHYDAAQMIAAYRAAYAQALGRDF
jgi:glycosyltransferase involved in cell wall biosynthesis